MTNWKKSFGRKIVSKLKPTLEQKQALELFLTQESLKINAYAGTGKTSTLVMLSEADNRKGLYLAFNRAIVNDAKEKFNSSTSCMTISKLALKSLSKELRKKAFGSTNAKALVKHLKLKDQIFGKKLKLPAKTFAFLIIQTIKQFCQGADETIQSIDLYNYGKLSGLNAEDKMAVSLQLEIYAEMVWNRMIAPDDADIQLGVSTAT